MEAEEYVKNFGTKNSLILVPRAIQMPRAVMHFRKAGTNPIVAPASFILKYGSHIYPWRWVPASENKEMLEEAIH
ncbi:MAG: hypothetical protein NT144_09995 [Bacteroidia bacterium]|nr:hypothetical protein [Bacteroidia bacterium]